MKKPILVFLLLSGFGISGPCQNRVSRTDLETVFKWMSGVFSSEAQSRTDSSFFHISLRMRPIWSNRKGENWLYVEQAMATALQKPYRQRVYQLTLSGDTAIVSTVFELPRPERFIGGTLQPELLQTLNPDSLINRKGCAITLKKEGEALWSGSTPGKECLSSLRGAQYATSKVSVRPEGIVSWDQGWDAADKQVWGAVKGGYRFDKKENW